MLSFLRLIIFTLMFLPLFTQAENLVLKVNINTADVDTLNQALEGIGEKKARAIVEYREKHGPFKTIYDLAHVTGIGEKTIERNKERIEVSLPESSTESAPSTEKVSSNRNNNEPRPSSEEAQAEGNKMSSKAE